MTYSFVKCGCAIYCFPQFRKSDMSRYRHLEVFQRVPWSEIMRVDFKVSKFSGPEWVSFHQLGIRSDSHITFLFKFFYEVRQEPPPKMAKY